MRTAATLLVTGMTFLSASTECAAAVLVEGTLAGIGPQGIIVKTANGDVPVPIARTNRVIVRAVADPATLADGTPCLLQGGSMRAGDKEINGAFVLIAGPQAGPFDDHVLLQADGGVSFQNVPGRLKKGPPAAFHIGRTEHLTLSADGRLDPAPRQQENLFNNRIIPFAGGQVGAAYDFGPDLRMAGANAKVRVVGTANNPAGATIHIDRVEPFPALK